MNTPIQTLAEAVRANAEVVKNTEDGTYVGMFTVRPKEGCKLTAHELARMIRNSPQGMFGDLSVERLKEGPSYIELGGWIGDQELALSLMGLGASLGLWNVVTPRTLGFSDDKAGMLMGMGFVLLEVPKDSLLANS